VVNEPTYGTGGVIAGSLWIIVLIFAVDALFALLQYAVTPVPLRKLGRRPRADAVVDASWETKPSYVQ
jgi:peptidoglycan/LPS O-acetylase OafA/YrhL